MVYLLRRIFPQRKDINRHRPEGHIRRIEVLENELQRLQAQRALVQGDAGSWTDSYSQSTDQGISTFPEWWPKLLKLDVEIGRVHCRLDGVLPSI